MPRHIDVTENGKGYRILIEEACFQHAAGSKIYIFQKPQYYGHLGNDGGRAG